MIVTTSSSYSIFLLQTLRKRFIIILLLIFVVLNPIITINNLFDEVKHELLEVYEEIESKDKKEVNEIEEENQLFHLLGTTNAEFKTNDTSTYSATQKRNLSYNYIIPLPPPERI